MLSDELIILESRKENNVFIKFHYEIKMDRRNIMGFIFAQLKMLLAAIVIMACALGGTIGIMKVIRRFAPNIGPWDGTSQHLPGAKHHDDEEEEVQ